MHRRVGLLGAFLASFPGLPHLLVEDTLVARSLTFALEAIVRLLLDCGRFGLLRGKQSQAQVPSIDPAIDLPSRVGNDDASGAGRLNYLLWRLLPLRRSPPPQTTPPQKRTPLPVAALGGRVHLVCERERDGIQDAAAAAAAAAAAVAAAAASGIGRRALAL
jgi:hypothetical protein